MTHKNQERSSTDAAEQNKKLTIYDFGCTDYQIIWQFQQDLVQQRLKNEMPDMLLIGEHPPVITTGRAAKTENILTPQIPIVEIERGGDATYHGPGQLIAYPIIKLPENERDLHAYLRKLEEVLILTLRDFGLWAIRHEGYTGVWVLDQTATSDTAERIIRRPRKIASIGVAVKQWVTYHGLALNVSTDLTPYTQINPCGLPAEVMTSLVAQAGPRAITMAAVKTALAKHFGQVFHYPDVSTHATLLTLR